MRSLLTLNLENDIPDLPIDMIQILLEDQGPCHFDDHLHHQVENQSVLFLLLQHHLAYHHCHHLHHHHVLPLQVPKSY